MPPLVPPYSRTSAQYVSRPLARPTFPGQPTVAQALLAPRTAASYPSRAVGCSARPSCYGASAFFRRYRRGPAAAAPVNPASAQDWMSPEPQDGGVSCTGLDPDLDPLQGPTTFRAAEAQCISSHHRLHLQQVGPPHPGVVDLPHPGITGPTPPGPTSRG